MHLYKLEHAGHRAGRFNPINKKTVTTSYNLCVILERQHPELRGSEIYKTLRDQLLSMCEHLGEEQVGSGEWCGGVTDAGGGNGAGSVC